MPLGSFADYLELKLLDHVFSAESYASPTDLYIGLSTTPINEDGSNITEPPAPAGYARAQVANDAANWPPAIIGGDGRGYKANGNEIAFPQATGDWGVVVDFFIADSQAAGNILAFGTLTSSKTIEIGDTASFAPGACEIFLD